MPKVNQITLEDAIRKLRRLSTLSALSPRRAPVTNVVEVAPLETIRIGGGRARHLVIHVELEAEQEIRATPCESTSA